MIAMEGIKGKVKFINQINISKTGEKNRKQMIKTIEG